MAEPQGTALGGEELQTELRGGVEGGAIRPGKTVIQAAGPPSQMLFSPRCCEERARPGSGPASTMAGCDLGVPVTSEPPAPSAAGRGPVLLASQDCGKNQAKAEHAAPCSPRRETALPADTLLWGDNWEQRLLVPRLPVTPKPLQVFAAVEKNKTAEVDHSGDVDSRV